MTGTSKLPGAAAVAPSASAGKLSPATGTVGLSGSAVVAAAVPFGFRLPAASSAAHG